MKIAQIASIILIATTIAIASPIGPIPSILPFYALGTSVEIVLIGADAAYLDILHSTPLSNRDPLGSSVILPTIPGQPLFLAIDVVQTGETFWQGAGSVNPDGIVHAWEAELPSGIWLGFEDIWGGGDLDFNDAEFVVYGATHVPEPSTLPLLAIGIGAALIWGGVRKFGAGA